MSSSGDDNRSAEEDPIADHNYFKKSVHVEDKIEAEYHSVQILNVSSPTVTPEKLSMVSMLTQGSS
jgi:hypothetical protein